MASKAVIDTLIAEAGGEGEDGLIAAAWAIQQRAAANGVSIDKVVRSGFDGFTNPGSGAVKAQADPALRRRVEQIMSGVESGSIPNPVPGADHFLSGSVMPGWAKGMKLVATVGGHRFYASGKVPETAQGNSVGTRLDTQRPAPTPAKPSATMTASRNRQNMTPAADTAPRTVVTPSLTRDGRGVTDPAAIVLGKEMTTRLAQPANAALARPQSYAGQDRAPSGVGKPPATRVVQSVPVKPRAPTITASDRARSAAVAPRAPATPPSSGKSASANVASARNEQAAARGPAPKKQTAVEAITRLAEIPGPNAAPKTAERLTTPALAFAGGAVKQPTEPELEAATGFRIGSPLAVAGVAPAVQSAAMIAARQPKKVAPVPLVRAPVVVARKPVIVAPRVVARAPAPAPVVARTKTPAEIIAFGQRAVSQSGDTSTGNQAEAAAARASGAAWRASR